MYTRWARWLNNYIPVYGVWLVSQGLSDGRVSASPKALQADKQ